MFLPDVTSLIGARLIDTWTGRETSEVVLPAPPDLEIPAPGFAFDHDGEPIASVHRIHGRSVRAALCWNAEQEALSPCGVVDARQHRPSASSGLIGDDAARGGCWTARMLSSEDWELAYEIVVLPREMRNGARLALHRVALAIAHMASLDSHDEGAITLIGRPLLGGRPQGIDRSVWATGPALRLRRLAACGLNIDTPFDPAASISHLIFVVENGLHEAVSAYTSNNRFLAIDEVQAWWPTTEQVRRGWTPDLADKVREALAAELLRPENRYWRLPQAQQFIARHRDFGSGYDAVVARVCSGLKKQVPPPGLSYGSLGVSGKPRRGLRLVRER